MNGSVVIHARHDRGDEWSLAVASLDSRGVGHRGPSMAASFILTVALSGFNVLNHTNYVTYVGVLGSPFFGHPVSAQAPRRIQLNVKLYF
jgi:hypothetical protein